MYEQHFGLQKRPFNVKATGTEVFVGPQTAKTMAGFRKALAVQDAVVTVSGAAGTGKTTLVERSLDAIGSKYKTIRVGRMQMNASDVLESLLIVLGVQDRPTGTIQRFTALRKKLKDLQDAGTRVFILVEDALRAGTDTLAELEALTVADAGESDGASIVLMGDERLFEYMKEPQLAQLQQRVRQRHRIKPLCVAELRGYLKHCLRMAGSDFDQLFDARSAELVHGLCDGVPRVANNIVDAVLTSAASQGLDRISAGFIASVAEDEFGLTVEDFDFSIADAEATAPGVEAAPPAESAVVPVDSTESAHATPTVTEKTLVAGQPPVSTDAAHAESEETGTTEANPVTQQSTAATEDPVETQEPAIVPADEKDESAADSMDIPHLIQDTLPDLAVLSERYAALEESYVDNPPEGEPQPAADDAADDAAEDIPELHAEPQDEPVADPAPAKPVVEDTPTSDVPEVTPAAEPEIAPDWQLTPEPEFELVNEVVPSLKIEVPEESGGATTSARNDMPDTLATLSPEPVADVIPELKVDLEASPVADDIPEVEAEPAPVADHIPELQVEPTPTADEIPELTIEPEATSGAQPAATKTAEQAEPVPVPDTTKGESQAAGAAKNEPEQTAEKEDIAEWDRDPTLAQLKPDLDALEQAMAFTHGEPAVNSAAAAPAPEELAKSVAEPEELPEIILDKSIETGIENLNIEEPADIQPPNPVKKPDPELDRIAADIANAKSIEDIDDIMAETLFGTGISIIAAQVTANPPQDDSANDELELIQEQLAAPAPPPPLTEDPAPAKKYAAPLDVDRPDEEISIETKAPVANTGLDLSASQRLKTVRALNADLHPSSREPGSAGARGAATKAAKAPEPIEDQINTSITQTLKALKVPPNVLDDEPDDEPKKGFLSRFRRS